MLPGYMDPWGTLPEYRNSTQQTFVCTMYPEYGRPRVGCPELAHGWLAPKHAVGVKVLAKCLDVTGPTAWTGCQNTTHRQWTEVSAVHISLLKAL